MKENGNITIPPQQMVENNVYDDRPVIKSKKDDGDSISPLIRFESAVIRHPPPAHHDIIKFDNGLRNDDINANMDGDLLLESQDSLETNHREDQLRLQRHWDLQQQQQQQQQSSRSSSSNNERFNAFDLNIWPNLECGSGGGGHVVLGRNASGKTLLSHSLVYTLTKDSNQTNDNDGCDNPAIDDDVNNNDNPFLHSGILSTTKRNATENRNHRFLSRVSFDSHSDLLLDANTTTVHRALIPSGGNRLSPTAKFLAVRSEARTF